MVESVACVDGTSLDTSVYLIRGSNFFKIRKTFFAPLWGGVSDVRHRRRMRVIPYYLKKSSLNRGEVFLGNRELVHIYSRLEGFRYSAGSARQVDQIGSRHDHSLPLY